MNSLRDYMIREELALDGLSIRSSKKEKQMGKNINAERQSPNSVPTPLKKQEPTAAIWKKGGAMSPGEALGTDKGDVRKPVQGQ